MFNGKLKQELEEAQLQLQTCQNNLSNTTTELNQVKEELVKTGDDLTKCKTNALALKTEYGNFRANYLPIINVEAETEKWKAALEAVKNDSMELKQKYERAMLVYLDLKKKVELFEETLELREYGVYSSKYSFDLPEQYKIALDEVSLMQKEMVKTETAVVSKTEWWIGGSLAEGKKMVKQYTKLMLFAFNGECDALIAKVKWNNVTKMEQRIHDAYATVNKLGVTNNINITPEYLQLKLKELTLTYEYEQKKYEEKEEQRRIKEQMREEEKAQKEFERAQKEAEDEERKYERAIEKAKNDLIGDTNPAHVDELNAKILQLEASLQEAHAKKERAISLAQTTKVGHIYVISNIGSFGEDVYKIGMTRRLDPNDRVKELGDASVPFQFDVHAIIYSDNAPQLEYELHKQFADKRLNRINQRKEFFRVSLDEIEAFIKLHTNAEIAFTKLADAKEFRETTTLLQQILATVEGNTAASNLQPEFPGSIDL